MYLDDDLLWEGALAQKLGQDSEARFFIIIDKVRALVPFRIWAKRAPRWLDWAGIDYVLVVVDQGKTYLIPVQIKSSYHGVLKFYTQYPDYVKFGVVTIKMRGQSDEEILTDLQIKIYNAILLDRTYSNFFSYLRKKYR